MNMDVSETLTLTEVTQPSRVGYVYIMCKLCGRLCVSYVGTAHILGNMAYDIWYHVNEGAPTV